jgi:hypothetical protein
MSGPSKGRKGRVRKSALVSLLAVALLLVAAVPSDAWQRHRGGVRGRVLIGVGPAFWWGAPYPYWWYYPAPYYVYPPPAIIVEQPPVYIQQQPPLPPPPQVYWYYCPSAQAYYPSVQTCPEAWVKVLPRPQ